MGKRFSEKNKIFGTFGRDFFYAVRNHSFIKVEMIYLKLRNFCIHENPIIKNNKNIRQTSEHSCQYERLENK